MAVIVPGTMAMAMAVAMSMAVIMIVVVIVFVIVVVVVFRFHRAGFPEGHRIFGLAAAAAVTHVAVSLLYRSIRCFRQSMLRDRTLSSRPCRTSTSPSPQSGQMAMK